MINGDDKMTWIYKVAHDPDAKGCVLWPSEFGRGPGQPHSIQRRGVAVQTPLRVMCWEVHGAPPSPSSIAVCDCVNYGEGCISPMHVRWVERPEFRAINAARQAAPRGELHANAKLNDEIVRAIILSDQSHAKTAARYGVSTSVVYRIRAGLAWKHVTV